MSDSVLVLDTLRGLDPKFSNAGSIIGVTTPFPTFIRAQSMLLLDEMRFDSAAKIVAAAAALFTAILWQPRRRFR